MKKFAKVLSLVLALSLVLCAFAACGGQTEDATDASADASADVSADASADVSADASLATPVSDAALKIIDIPLTEEEYAYAVKKGDAELLASLNEFLASIKADGTFEDIVDRYFGDGTPEGVLIADTVADDTKDQLVIATNAAFAPFEYVEGDKYFGVDIEIMNLFAKSLNKELCVNNMEFDSVCTSVGAGTCDVAAAGLTVNDERKEILDFSDSYYNAAQMIITSAADDSFDACETVADVEAAIAAFAADTKVGVQTGTTGSFYVAGDADWGFEGFSNINVVGYSSGAFAVQDILNNNIAFVVIDEAPAKTIVESVNAVD